MTPSSSTIGWTSCSRRSIASAISVLSARNCSMPTAHCKRRAASFGVTRADGISAAARIRAGRNSIMSKRWITPPVRRLPCQNPCGDALGGFDERYAPAYFDDSDLAFALRARGLRTLYAPAAQIIHHEGISNGTDLEAGVKAHQVTNRRKFTDKWHSVLSAEHGPDGHDAFLARDRSRFRKHILVIDHYIPQFDRDAGSRTIFAYLKMFVDAGLQVVFWPDNLHRDRDYAKALQDLGVEVLYDAQLTKPFGDWIAEHGRYIDYVLFSRAHVSLNYIDSVIEHTRARRLYYGHDLHAERLEREYAMTGRHELLHDIEFWRDAELDIWKRADVVYYPAQEEADAVRRQLPGKTARVLTPYIYSAREIADGRARVEAGHEGSPTLLFVGGFRHRPNIDAAICLVRDILPQVRAGDTGS